MLKPSNNVDPSLFQKAHEMMFEAMIIDAALELERASEEIRSHEVPDKSAQTMAMYGELREEWKGEGNEDLLEEVFGDDLETVLDMVTQQPVKRINAAGEILPSEDEELSEAKEQAGTKLVDHTCGYQRHLEQGMVAAGMNTEDAGEEAWRSTWSRLRGILLKEGTLLAEVAGFYDGVARSRFGNDYKPMDETRGEAVSRDVCARTFYEVMGNHVPRAIIGQARDEWTGY